MIKLLVGLGNPGPEYEGTRHNAGFWCVDAMAHALALHLTLDRSYQSLLTRGSFDGHPIWLMQPQTFMNLSGRPVASLARFFKIASDEILVVHDDMDIAPGEAKLRLGGSHAGHNGLRDIHAQLGSDRYWRLRLGVGHPGVKSEVVSWVLKKPSPDHRIAIAQTIDRAVKALPLLLRGDTERATLQIHTSKPPRPKPARPAPETTATPTPAPPPVESTNNSPTMPGAATPGHAAR